jgi:hypothetical protein
MLRADQREMQKETSRKKKRRVLTHRESHMREEAASCASCFEYFHEIPELGASASGEINDVMDCSTNLPKKSSHFSSSDPLSMFDAETVSPSLRLYLFTSTLVLSRMILGNGLRFKMFLDSVYKQLETVHFCVYCSFTKKSLNRDCYAY